MNGSPDEQAVGPSAASPEAHALDRHALRTPLNQIIGYSELLIDEAAERRLDDQLEDLRKIHKAGKDLLALLDQALAADSRLERRPASTGSKLAASQPAGLSGQIPDESAPAAVLVVDDNETNRDLLSRRVEREGYKTEVAENGREALERLGLAPYDLVLLDILMPEMDGYQTLAEMKSHPALRNIPVIMISAVDQIESVVRCIELGADDYLPKPFNPTLLKARISASIEKKRLRDREVRFYEEIHASYRRLQELEQLRDDLTHMIVHDLRTPLTSVISGLQTMEMLGELNDDQREFLEIALTGGQTLLGMINDMLDVSKMESGTLTLERQPMRPSELAEASLAQVRQLAREKDLTLAQDISEELPSASLDAEKIGRTLVNLLSNAIKFTPAGGIVTLLAYASVDGAGDLVFAVRDTGEGIPQEAFDRIFEKFGQVEGRKSGRRMSTGLGLTFCKMAVEAHGGRIWVESELGAGSTFLFALPLSSNTPAP